MITKRYTKKAGGLVAIFLLAAGPGQAQLLHLGLKAGGNVSNVVGYSVESSSWRAALHGGLVAQLRPTNLPNWSLQGEALYTMKGDNSLSYGPSLTYRLAYLDLPILLQYRAGDIFFEAGPQASHLLAARPANPLLALPGKATFRPWSYGFAVGFGYQDESGVQIGWRYNADLTNLRKPIVFENRNAAFPDERLQVRMRNSVMELYLGYNAGAGQLGSTLAAAGSGIVQGAKFVVTAPGRLFRKQPKAPEAAPAAPAPTGG